MEKDRSGCEQEIRARPHPYLSGNFAPINKEIPLTRCEYTGKIPACLAGGEYVRNGGNPLKNDDLGRDAHWFDGDGMLSGVLFRRVENSIQPEFVNAYVLTDVFLASAHNTYLSVPILPSITSLLNPLSTFISIFLTIMRTIMLVFLSHLPGTTQKIVRISVANTGVLWHDGRALATCESGPPMRILLPGLESVGWYNGSFAEGEPVVGDRNTRDIYGDHGIIGWMKEWTTAHPRVDPNTKELISFHSSFLPPYVRYSIVPSEDGQAHKQYFDYSKGGLRQRSVYNEPIPGVLSAKMMHDFGVSSTHTVIMDLPLSLDPLNLLKNKPVVAFDANSPSRFGVFPRYKPDTVQWFEEDQACCIFHTANTYNETDPLCCSEDCVKMLSCRLNSATLVFAAGDLPSPATALAKSGEEDLCQLYYHAFQLKNGNEPGKILHSFPLSAIPFEFPAISPSQSMNFVRYVYGCSLSQGNFSSALGRAAKIDCLVKTDVKQLLQAACGRTLDYSTPVDVRSISEIIADDTGNENIKVFKFPSGVYAQEAAFVSKFQNGKTMPEDLLANEDDGYLLTYVFNENEGLDMTTLMPYSDAKSELWVIDAKTMDTVVCKIILPQRVPYGLHGTFFSELQVNNQRVVESIRQFDTTTKDFHKPLEANVRINWGYTSLRQWFANAGLFLRHQLLTMLA